MTEKREGWSLEEVARIARATEARDRDPSFLGTVRGMAFSSDGTELWTAHGVRGIVVWRWPEMEQVRRIAMPAARLAADGGAMLALHAGGVIRFEGGTTTALATKGVRAFGVDERGALSLVRCEGHQVSLERVEAESGARRMLGSLTVGRPSPWDLLVLPGLKIVVAANNDAPAEWIDVATEVVSEVFDIFEAHGLTLSHRSWLAADPAPRDQAFMFSNKGSETYVVWLSGVGVPTRVVELERMPFPEDFRSMQKGPGRGVAHALHPSDGSVVHTDVSARFLVHDGHNGRLLRAHDLPIGGGYRHEGN